MIIAQSHQTRRFTGRFDVGSDIYESLIEMCKSHNVKCGFFRGSGYLKTVKLINFDPDKKAFHSIETLMGPFLAPIINGNISQQGDELSCELFAVIGSLRKDRSYDSLRCVHLAGGEIISFEFTLTTFDDILLVRDIDKKSGLRQWFFVEQFKDKKEEIPTLVNSFGKEKEEEDLWTENFFYKLKKGDLLDHPKFGLCKITATPDSNKIPVEITKTGKSVELHISLLKILSPQTDDGKMVYPLEIKKK